MPRFEYMLILAPVAAPDEDPEPITVNGPSGQQQRPSGSLTSVLNEVGGEGWELVSSFAAGQSFGLVMTFALKRQIA
jgi:hypothetical protein